MLARAELVTGGIKISEVVGMLCFFFVSFYGEAGGHSSHDGVDDDDAVKNSVRRLSLADESDWINTQESALGGTR